MNFRLLSTLWAVLLIAFVGTAAAQQSDLNRREKLLMNFDWKFAYGHPFDADKDFSFGTSYFSFFAKAGYGDGPASANFDDRAWRTLDIPHDFAVEQPFNNTGSHSHGYKAIGRNFPDVSVGWYRKSFEVPEKDLGRRITVTFEGVHRDSRVFINGHYLGNEPSGYSSFTYDLTEYLNYGGRNVLSVRVDATYEEGWYYEGAGIYRHVWLTKHNPVHVAHDGTFVYTKMDGNAAMVTVETTVENKKLNATSFKIKQELKDAQGNTLAEAVSEPVAIKSFGQAELKQTLKLENPRLWSLEDPYLHTVVTSVIENGVVTDQYPTVTGIRTIRFDANEGFFLNGKHVKLKGTNNHQDHAGVGTAMPDELQAFRVMKLKEMGSNAIRSSHNPASPALLEACDRLGMLIIDEHRLMGTAPFVKDQLERLIKRDRNHPSVIVWSMGNEEWAIEGNIVGERIIKDMQAFANTLDHTRPKNAASSGGWGNGVSKHIEVMGFNYLNHGSTDEYHKNFPNTPTIGTEEGSTNTTRGVYFDDFKRQHLVAYDRPTANGYFFSIEHCWKHYDSRPYLSGMFIWTGFDYRGEPTPFSWPSVLSYFGMYDNCGFPKDNVYYLKSWWGNEPVLHLLPHWNWAGKEGETIKVVAYSNLDAVELIVNKKSLGKKTVEKNSHVSWEVPYKAGNITAVAYKNGKKTMTKTIETTGAPASLALEAHKPTLKANGEDLAIISVSTRDSKGRLVPTAENKVYFEIEGPAKIIGVGNGDPTCLEPDRQIERNHTVAIRNLKAQAVDGIENRPEIAMNYDDSQWKLLRQIRDELKGAKAIVFRGVMELPENLDNATSTLFYNCIGNTQSVYINGKLVADSLLQSNERYALKLTPEMLKPGRNEIAIVATPFVLRNTWDNPNIEPGVLQVVQPAAQYSRSLFAGYAQVIVQATKESGTVKLTAKSEGLQPTTLTIVSENAPLRPAVASK